MEQEWMENFYEYYDGVGIRATMLATAAIQNSASFKMYVWQAKHLGMLGKALEAFNQFQLGLLLRVEGK